jgi:hypothetical protein
MKITGGEPSVRRTPAEHIGKASPGELASGQKVSHDFLIPGKKFQKMQGFTAPDSGVFRQNSSLSGLLASLKLPQDGLSRSIIAFARFFSLPLEPKILNVLRREALSQPLREAAALGAAAAADKGLELPAGILKEYAAALEGDREAFSRWQLPGEEDPENSNGGTADNPEPEKRNSYPNHSRQERRDSEDSGGDHTTGGQAGNKAQGSPEEVQFHVKEVLKSKPLLDFINRIPGKNFRWVILPFSFNKEGVEFTVSLRLLLDPQSNGRLCADIKVSRPREKQRRWLISLEKPDLDSKSAMQAEISLFFGGEPCNFTENEKQALETKLAEALELSLDRVTVQLRPLFTDSRDDLLRQVDEEV